MKITCQSCQSKYNVADDKVQGKVVKIRCRKCGSTIVVNGTNVTAANGAAEATDVPPPVDASARPGETADPWHVNVAENDQRTMSLAELVEAYNSGTVTQDSFIWTEGMGDWKPLGEVEAVVSALHANASESAAGAREEPAVALASAYPAPAAQVPASAFPAPVSYDPAPVLAAAAAAEPSPAKAEGRRAAVKREGRGRDLFGSGASGASGLGDASSQDFGVETSAPLMGAPGVMPPMDDPNRLTGERNENSVLFSLAVLTKNAEQRAPNEAQVTNAEDSGLIDLKALAAKTESMRPATAGVADAAVFASPIGAIPAFQAPLGSSEAPLGDGHAKSQVPRIIGLVAAVALLLVVGVVIGVKFAAPPAAAPTAASAGASAPTASAGAPEGTASAAASAPADSASAAPSASVATSPQKPRQNPGGGGAWHPQATVQSKPATGGGTTPQAAPPAAGAPAPAKKNDCGCNGDLMCMMKCSTH
jgi:predicted Zn finger-like uncharacterized protein